MGLQIKPDRNHSRQSHQVYGRAQPAIRERPHQPPIADAAAVFTALLDIEIPPPDPRIDAQVRQPRFGLPVAFQNRPFLAFFIIDTEVHGNPRPTRSVRKGRIVRIADKIAGWMIRRKRHGVLPRI